MVTPLNGLPEHEYERIANAISDELPKLDGHPFDVVPLNTANSIFAFKVIKGGRLIYNRMPSVITDFIERISRLYGENYPRYREALRMITGV